MHQNLQENHSVEERTIELERPAWYLRLDVGHIRNKLCPILKSSYPFEDS